MPGSGPTLTHPGHRGCGARLLCLRHSGLELYNMPAQLKLTSTRADEAACSKNMLVSDDLPELL